MEHIGKYRTEIFQKSRTTIMDICDANRRKHYITAFIELDVTEARKVIFERKKQRRPVSFNSWIIKCISETVEEFRAIHGIRKGKKEIVIFEDIDISILVEREIQGEKVPLPYVIRKTNKKNISEIYDEIKIAQSQPIIDEGDYVLGQKKNEYLMKIYYLLPSFVRKLIWIKIIQNPSFTKEYMGTVVISSVGMMGKINGWVIPISIHPISFAVGSIIKKPGIKDDNIEIREFLKMTVSVDHDVIDGAPAVRALNKLTNLVEGGFGLS